MSEGHNPRSLLGGPVDGNRAVRPSRSILKGEFVSLVPLDAEAHCASLYEATHGPEREDLWRYLFDGPFSSKAEFNESLRQKAASEDPLFLAILDNSAREPMGYAAYMRIESAHRVIEVGSILYSPALQRTAGATEAMYLMARHAFEDLGYRRYEWKCNTLNAPSRRAAHRLGFTFEGIFRQHMIVKGRSRDTAWYSMLDCEWPSRKRAFEHWLAPSNFDNQGKQKRSLLEFRELDK